MHTFPTLWSWIVFKSKLYVSVHAYCMNDRFIRKNQQRFSFPTCVRLTFADVSYDLWEKKGVIFVANALWGGWCFQPERTVVLLYVSIAGRYRHVVSRTPPHSCATLHQSLSLCLTFSLLSPSSVSVFESSVAYSTLELSWLFATIMSWNFVRRI